MASGNWVVLSTSGIPFGGQSLFANKTSFLVVPFYKENEMSCLCRHLQHKHKNQSRRDLVLCSYRSPNWHLLLCQVINLNTVIRSEGEAFCETVIQVKIPWEDKIPERSLLTPRTQQKSAPLECVWPNCATWLTSSFVRDVQVGSAWRDSIMTTRTQRARLAHDSQRPSVRCMA